MIQVIHGKKGSGKTKRILDQANEAIKEQKDKMYGTIGWQTVDWHVSCRE